MSYVPGSPFSSFSDEFVRITFSPKLLGAHQVGWRLAACLLHVSTSRHGFVFLYTYPPVVRIDALKGSAFFPFLCAHQDLPKMVVVYTTLQDARSEVSAQESLSGQLESECSLQGIDSGGYLAYNGRPWSKPQKRKAPEGKRMEMGRLSEFIERPQRAAAQ
jgi:hypothetical protein